jgi:hypothetical protein
MVLFDQEFISKENFFEILCPFSCLSKERGGNFGFHSSAQAFETPFHGCFDHYFLNF